MDDFLGMSQPQQAQPNFMDMLHQGAISAGIGAIKAGIVAPQKAAKEAKNMCVGDPNELDSVIKGDKPHFDYTFGSPQAQKVKPQEKKTTKEQMPVDPETAQANLGILQSIPGYQEAQSGGGDLQKNVMAMLQAQPESNAWIKPLAGLADYVSKQSGNQGNALASFTPNGMSSAERAQVLLKYQDEAQKRREDNFKALVTGLSSLTKAGGSTVNVVGGQNGSGFNSQEGRDDRFHNEVLRKLDNNPTIQKQINASNGLENSLELLSGQNGVTVNPALFHEAMQTMRTNTVGAGKSIGDERADTYMQSLAKKWESYFGEKVANGVVSIPQSDPQLQQAKAELAAARKMITNQRGRLMDQLISGHGSIYSRRPDLKQDLEDRISAMSTVLPERPDIAPLPKTVKVTNGKETLEIPEADLEAAKKDGYAVKK